MNDKLTKDEVYKVLTKLIGDIEPVADAAIDSESVIGNKPKSKSKKTLITPESFSKICDIIKRI